MRQYIILHHKTEGANLQPSWAVVGLKWGPISRADAEEAIQLRLVSIEEAAVQEYSCFLSAEFLRHIECRRLIYLLTNQLSASIQFQYRD